MLLPGVPPVVMPDVTILLNAIYQGESVTVTHATHDEIEFLAGGVESADDMLEFWSLIAIRFGTATEIHALGWRLLAANTYITSLIVAVDLTRGAIRTRSGKNYLLGVHDQPGLDPELRDRLTYALRHWGFDDVGQ
jgi:hypothetical protein